jgi:hypothetical protein
MGGIPRPGRNNGRFLIYQGVNARGEARARLGAGRDAVTPERGQAEPHGAGDGKSAGDPPAPGPAKDLRRPGGVRRTPDFTQELARSTGSPEAVSCESLVSQNSQGARKWSTNTSPSRAPRESGSLSSPAFGNKPRHAGLHHNVEPDSCPNRVPDLLHGVFRQSRDVKVLLDTAGRRRGS